MVMKKTSRDILALFRMRDDQTSNPPPPEFTLGPRFARTRGWGGRSAVGASGGGLWFFWVRFKRPRKRQRGAKPPLSFRVRIFSALLLREPLEVHRACIAGIDIA